MKSGVCKRKSDIISMLTGKVSGSTGMDSLVYSIGFFNIVLASKKIGKYFSGFNLPHITG
jgi:hypothetical protein